MLFPFYEFPLSLSMLAQWKIFGPHPAPTLLEGLARVSVIPQSVKFTLY